MITGAPLPGWGELAALFGGSAAGAAVAAHWAEPTEKTLWFSRSAWALAAITTAWRRKHGRLPRLWVPDYFCNASLDPVRQAGVPLTFYPVGPDLVPDWEQCRRLALSAAPDLFIAVHYFGFATDLRTAREFCRLEGALLIEDCAHVLEPAAGIGRGGDFVLWSPHKLLPVPQGGLLVCRDLDEDASPAAGPAPGLGGWLLKRMVQKLGPGWLLPPATRSGPQTFGDDPVGGPLAETPSLAPKALKILAKAADALPRVAARRRDTARALLEVLARQDGWQPLFDPTAATPYRLVMRCDSPDIAAERFTRYRRRGIPVESWPDLAPDVRALPAQHRAALHLRATLLCFPVHQTLEAGALTRRCGGPER